MKSKKSIFTHFDQYQSTFLGLLINTQFQKYFAVCAFSYFLYKYYIIIFFKNQQVFYSALYKALSSISFTLFVRDAIEASVPSVPVLIWTYFFQTLFVLNI